jgi:hypothetical protein
MHEEVIMIDDAKTDPTCMAQLLRHLADDIDRERFPAWVIGRCRRAVEAELSLWMSTRREPRRPALRVVR